MYDEYCLWAQVAVLLMLGLYCTVWDKYMQVLYLGRAPRTKETLPDCWRNVGSPDIHECFRGLTGSQRTPGFGASHLSSVPMQPYMKHELSLLGRYVQIRF